VLSVCIYVCYYECIYLHAVPLAWARGSAPTSSCWQLAQVTVSAVSGCGCCKSRAIPSETKRVVGIVCAVARLVVSGHSQLIATNYI
jgi:hypothetical protein